MKRDLDLARQLLFDIEAHGANCAVSTLRANVADGADERVRYHLRLLIDAQLAKEIDRTASGVPCVRLTNAGHELLELARSDAQWQEARRRAVEATGGDSLTVIRAVLTKWAVESAVHAAPLTYRRPRTSYHRIERPRRYTGYYYEREPLVEQPRTEVVRPRSDYREQPWRERFDWRDGYYGRVADLVDVEREYDESTVGVSLPVSLI